MKKKQIELITVLASVFSETLDRAERSVQSYRYSEKQVKLLEKKSVDCKYPAKKRREFAADLHRHRTHLQELHRGNIISWEHPSAALQLALRRLPGELQHQKTMVVDMYRKPNIFVRLWRWIQGRKY